MRLAGPLGQQMDSICGATGSICSIAHCPLCKATNPWEHTANKHKEKHHFRLNQNKIPKGFGRKLLEDSWEFLNIL